MPATAVLLALLTLAPAEPVTDQDFERRSRDAVVDLHEFFEDWFNARVPKTRESTARFSDVLAEDFEYVGHAGYKLTKAELFDDGIWPPYGVWAGEGHLGGETRIEKVRFRRLSPETALLTWEYWQDEHTSDGVRSRGRLDTGILRLDDSKPHGVVWLHVHETRLPEDATP